MRSDTAHLAWNLNWSSAAGRADWLEPDPEVARLAEELARNGPVRALDIGCGVGRHALLLARHGIETTAVDLAEAGLAELRAAAAREGLSIATQIAPMTALPFPDGAFDCVLAWNVIYHGDGAVVRRAAAEIRRLVRPGGLFQGTMLSKRHKDFGVGTEVAPNTFVRTPDTGNSGDHDRSHPHFYCDAAELVALFDGFEPIRIEDREQRRPRSWHWHVLAERRA